MDEIIRCYGLNHSLHALMSYRHFENCICDVYHKVDEQLVAI